MKQPEPFPDPLGDLSRANEKARSTVAFVDGAFGGVAIRLPIVEDHDAFLRDLAEKDPALGREMKRRGWID